MLSGLMHIALHIQENVVYRANFSYFFPGGKQASPLNSPQRLFQPDASWSRGIRDSTLLSDAGLRTK